MRHEALVPTHYSKCTLPVPWESLEAAKMTPPAPYHRNCPFNTCTQVEPRRRKFRTTPLDPGTMGPFHMIPTKTDQTKEPRTIRATKTLRHPGYSLGVWAANSCEISKRNIQVEDTNIATHLVETCWDRGLLVGNCRNRKASAWARLKSINHLIGRCWECSPPCFKFRYLTETEE